MSQERQALARRGAWLRFLPWRETVMERSTLIIFLVAALALFVFAQLADEVMEGETHAFDEYVLLALRSSTDLSDPLGPGWFEEMMRDFTALGATAVLVTVTLAVVGFLVLTGKRQAAVMIALCIATGILLSHGLKWGFARPRPDLVPHGNAVYTQSFPSGHAMLSAVVYLTLGALLARVQEAPRAKVYLLLVAGLLVMLIGASRVYLGVHWPTDVLAGWVMGAGWAILCWWVMLRVQRHNGPEGAAPAREPE
jgi:undecaprenyl-diphosphatase